MFVCGDCFLGFGLGGCGCVEGIMELVLCGWGEMVEYIVYFFIMCVVIDIGVVMLDFGVDVFEVWCC